ncbi:MAG: hypothetical protein KDI17_10345 [Halioglobus sp.]|nr:hypothetical protein [Halioglobus sp.]
MRRCDDETRATSVFTGAGRACDYRVQARDTAEHARARSPADSYVRLEIRSDTLYALIHDRALVVEDLRGLDGTAKNWIRRRLLETLLR